MAAATGSPETPPSAGAQQATSLDAASNAAGDRLRAAARQQAQATSAVADLLASLAARRSDPFSDRTTIVGMLDAAESSFGRDGGAAPSGQAESSKKAVQASTTHFAAALARTPLASSASLPAATVAARYAENGSPGA